MATDNVTLNAGSGGSTLRTLSDGTNEWPVSVLCYATTVSPGANVLQEVMPAFPLPVTAAITGSVAVTGTFWQATQPVSGSITANAGTNLNTSLLALESGGNLATIAGRTPALGQQLAAASTPVVLTAIQVAALTPLSTVGVTGTFWQTTQPVSIASAVATTQSGTWTNTVTQATASSLNATVVGTGTFAVQAAQSGTWNVGTVTTVTTVSAVTSITNALPAGTNLLGQMSVADQVASLFNGTTSITPQYAAITTSSSGATTVVSAVSGKKVYILRWSLTANGNVNVNWQSHTTTGTATGLHYMTQYASAGGAYCPAGIFATIAGEALDINLSGAVAVGGELTYVQF